MFLEKLLLDYVVSLRLFGTLVENVGEVPAFVEKFIFFFTCVRGGHRKNTFFFVLLFFNNDFSLFFIFLSLITNTQGICFYYFIFKEFKLYLHFIISLIFFLFFFFLSLITNPQGICFYSFIFKEILFVRL